MALAEWKYQSPRQSVLPGWGWPGCLLAAAAVIGGWLLGLGPVGVLPVGAAWWVSARNSGKLLVSSRYLISGTEIVYFANVSRALCEERRLSLTHLDGKVFVLEAGRFPSNARKADKIARHQADKFARVAERLIEHVRAAAPAAEIRPRDGR
ncbi:hypothetical protein [Chitinilyticum litopenaei]|uniref:hypothetical protein n=1 Tax=Chitinilyticum litopenaei TaxID=1121276 RepID=UPI000413E2F1|nr:hypothetical protein [Chitinilyticum litopenaei]